MNFNVTSTVQGSLRNLQRASRSYRAGRYIELGHKVYIFEFQGTIEFQTNVIIGQSAKWENVTDECKRIEKFNVKRSGANVEERESS